MRRTASAGTAPTVMLRVAHKVIAVMHRKRSSVRQNASPESRAHDLRLLRPGEAAVLSDDDLSMEDLADGLALWQEHKPQTPTDWIDIANRWIEAGESIEHSSPIFAALVLQTAALKAARP